MFLYIQAVMKGTVLVPRPAGRNGQERIAMDSAAAVPFQRIRPGLLETSLKKRKEMGILYRIKLCTLPLQTRWNPVETCKLKQ